MTHSSELEEQLAGGEMSVKFINDQERVLFAQVLLGEEAVTFLNSDLGRLLRGYAEQKREEAKEQLLTTPSWRKRKIQKLQFDAAVAGQFLEFIHEALYTGEVAYQNLTLEKEYRENRN